MVYNERYFSTHVRHDSMEKYVNPFLLHFVRGQDKLNSGLSNKPVLQMMANQMLLESLFARLAVATEMNP